MVFERNNWGKSMKKSFIVKKIFKYSGQRNDIESKALWASFYFAPVNTLTSVSY